MQLIITRYEPDTKLPQENSSKLMDINEQDHNSPTPTSNAEQVTDITLAEALEYNFIKKFDHKTTPSDLAVELQLEADNIVTSCENVDWSEDRLTVDLVISIRETLGKYIIPNLDCTSGLSKFDLEAYKITGEPEGKHGDIAIIVTRSFGGAKTISGVGFYEAKAASVVTNNYRNFDIRQLMRLVSSTPKLSYLFYDKQGARCDEQEWPTEVSHSNLKPGDVHNRRKTHVNTVDANFLKNCRDPHFAIDAVGQPFGYHFVNHILSGRDLDYSRAPIDTIMRWRKATKNSNAVVISITVQNDYENPIPTQLQLPGFEAIKLPELPCQKYRKRLNSDV